MSANPLHGLERCGICGGSMGRSRAVGHDDICRRCAAEYDPTPLQEWSQAIGVELRELPAMCGVAKRTVMRAARGIRISERAARTLSEVTDIPPETFTTEARFQG